MNGTEPAADVACRLSYRDMPVPVRPGASAAFQGNAVKKSAVTKKDLASKSIK